LKPECVDTIQIRRKTNDEFKKCRSRCATGAADRSHWVSLA
jgi:hypothetical protein